ncbi:zinc-binding alcohol dehydrogenase family protein [Streptomyces sp. NPDC057611]|uniref:quinone oxidoreductase family protein n=1 Tax=Streptomyces sp. NPDC057611 TaxID=3346182 RepID=UPI0036A88116
MQAVRRVEPGRFAVAGVELRDPTDGEIVVDVAFASVNPFDLQVLRGDIAPRAPWPLTLGAEASGCVDGVPVQVSGSGIGSILDGTFAPRLIAPQGAVRPLPHGADLEGAATVGVAGKTAWRVVHQLARVGADDVVLVLGGAGGVGLFAAQLARSTGAEVLVHTGSPAKAAGVEALGLQPVVADTRSALVGHVAAHPPTVVLDPLGGDWMATLLPALAPRARVVVYGTLAGRAARIDLRDLYSKGISVLGTSGATTPADESAQALAGALGAVVAGDVHVPREVLGLPDAGEAFDLLQARSVVGKLLLKP